MSSDNKFGKCCGCPARVNHFREIGEWESASIRIEREMKELNITNIYDYNDYLENNGKEMVETRFQNMTNANTCQNDASNQFYIDSSDFHQRFEQMNQSIVEEEIMPYDKNVSVNLSVKSCPNYSIAEISSDKPANVYTKA